MSVKIPVNFISDDMNDFCTRIYIHTAFESQVEIGAVESAKGQINCDTFVLFGLYRNENGTGNR